MVDQERVTKIKRAFLWIRKMLEITERTDVPESIENVVRPALDMLGWERMPEVTTVQNIGAAATAFVVSGVSPDNFVRVIVAAQVESSDVLLAQDLWLAQRGVLGVANDVAVSQVYSQAIGMAGTPAATDKLVFLSPGERLVGHSSPAPGVAQQLTMRHRQIDLPIGEYIPYL